MHTRTTCLIAAVAFLGLGALTANAEADKLPSIETAKKAVDDAVARAEENAAKVEGASAERLARLPYGKEFPPKQDLEKLQARAVLEAKRVFWEKARYVMACTRGRLLEGAVDDGSCGDVPVSAGGAGEADDLHRRVMLVLDVQEDIDQDRKELASGRPNTERMIARKTKLFQQLEARRSKSK